MIWMIYLACLQGSSLLCQLRLTQTICWRHLKTAACHHLAQQTPQQASALLTPPQTFSQRRKAEQDISLLMISLGALRVVLVGHTTKPPSFYGPRGKYKESIETKPECSHRFVLGSSTETLSSRLRRIKLMWSGFSSS